MKNLELDFRILLHEHFHKDAAYLGIRLRFFDFLLLIRIPILFYKEISK